MARWPDGTANSDTCPSRFDRPAHRRETRRRGVAPRLLPAAGIAGEHALQCFYDTAERASRFYAEQVRDRLLPAMVAFNRHIGLLMVDFGRDLIGLHVNGAARIVSEADFRSAHPDVPADSTRGRRAERWVVVDVDEAYVHCRKHIPQMERVTRRRPWGTDDPARKGGDYFGARDTPAGATPRT